MGKVSEVVGKMPFIGKSLVENTALEAICERTSMREKMVKAGRAAGFLAVFGVLHGFQAKLGVDELQYQATQMQDGVSVFEGAQTALASLYTLANTAVCYTQIQLSGRVGLNAFRFWNAHRTGKPFATEDYAFTPRQPTAAQTVFTSAGQALFIGQIMSH